MPNPNRRFSNISVSASNMGSENGVSVSVSPSRYAKVATLVGNMMVVTMACPWMSMDVHGCPWMSMDVHGCPWHLLGSKS